MANYQLGPVIGKLGGADVQKIPVDIVADGDPGSEIIMHTVNVPEGETWLVALAGDLDPSNMYGSGPVISLGEVSIGPRLPKGYNAIAAEVTGTAEIALKRNTNINTDIFAGHVYTVPLP